MIRATTQTRPVCGTTRSMIRAATVVGPSKHVVATTLNSSGQSQVDLAVVLLNVDPLLGRLVSQYRSDLHFNFGFALELVLG